MKDSKVVCEVDGLGYHPGILCVYMLYKMDRQQQEVKGVCLAKGKNSSRKSLCMNVCLQMYIFCDLFL